MNYYNLFAAAAAPVVCVGYFINSCRMNKDDAGERDSGASLIVLSGMLAALAILIPLGATLLPERHFAWQRGCWSELCFRPLCACSVRFFL